MQVDSTTLLDSERKGGEDEKRLGDEMKDDGDDVRFGSMLLPSVLCSSRSY